MVATSQQKGKLGELWVFGKLVDAGAKVYVPLVDEEGVDAIVRGKSEKLREIQVKSTWAPDQAGYFNAKVKPRPSLYIVCVELSPLDISGVRPVIWVFPSAVFTDPKYSTRMKSGEYRLPLAATSRALGVPRKRALAAYLENWPLLTA